MKINLKNSHNNDTVYATIRMNVVEYQALREYMHTKPGFNIWFPYGTEVVKHGYGWYRLLPVTTKRGVDKMQFALKVIRAFLREEEERVVAEIKLYVPIMKDADLHLASFSSAHSAGDYGYIGSPQPVVPRPADAQALHALAAKFSRGNHGV